MYSRASTENALPNCDPGLHGSELVKQWHAWAALETQRRVILGYYFLDGQICSLFDTPPSVRHTANSILPGSSDEIFLAPTAEAWQKMVSVEPDMSPRRHLSSFFDALTRPSGPREGIPPRAPGFTVAVLLEGLYTLVVDLRELPFDLRKSGRKDVQRSLAHFHEDFSESNDFRVDRLTLMMRWHMVSIALLELGLPSGQAATSARDEVSSWLNSPPGRRAVLHGNTIRQIVEGLPFSAISAPRLSTPICAYHASYILLLWWKFRSQQTETGGSTRMGQYWGMEEEVDWKRLGNFGHSDTDVCPESTTLTLDDRCRVFLAEGGLPTLQGRDIELTDLGSLASALNTCGGTWPIARNMAHQLTALSFG